MATYSGPQGGKVDIQGGTNTNFGHANQYINNGGDQNTNMADGQFTVNNYHGSKDDKDDEDRPLSPEIFKEELEAFKRELPLDDKVLQTLQGPQQQEYLNRWQLLIITALPGKLSLGGSKSDILDAMVRLSSISGLVPKRLWIENIGIKIDGAGAVSQPTDVEVFKGKVETLRVAVKTSKGTGLDEEQLKRLSCHALVLQKLDHPNVLPFLGLYYLDKSCKRPCLVYPWMEKRNIKEAKQENRNKVAQGAINGLVYIHSQGVNHGDLQNVSTFLINPSDVACIADLGLARLRDPSAGKNKTTDQCQCACVLYMELFGGKRVKRSEDGTVPPKQAYNKPMGMTDAMWQTIERWLSKGTASQPLPGIEHSVPS